MWRFAKPKRSPRKSGRRTGLARALSKLGHCSRSQAVQLILAGRVTLNGTARNNPETPVDLNRDKIRVDGAQVSAAAKIYLMLNKPRGIVTSAADEEGRSTIYSLLKNPPEWLAPVGRLDKASEGLLLLTNDSEWGAKIAAPETHLDKTYHVQIGGKLDEATLQRPRAGVAHAGEFLRAKSITILREGERNSWLEIILDEGKNRQIRRMLNSLGIEVFRIIRIAIGPLQLGDLLKGASRNLTTEEKQSLDRAIRGRARRGL